MIDRGFVEFVANKLGIERQELVEKDILLQSILMRIMEDAGFKDKFAFKGGTCLIKCYIGYYRFSEDLDFTYIDQKEFMGKSENSIRRILSQKVDLVLSLLKNVSDSLDLDFKADKTNSHYIEYGGGNRFVTLKMWYDSSVLNQRAFIKIQINFIEDLFWPVVKARANSVIKEDLAKEVNFIFKKYAYLTKPITVNAYSLNEILVEKIRAVITRKGIKVRDFVDIYLIQKKTKVNPKILEKEIIEKIVFMMRYEKYLKNIKNKLEELERWSGLRKDEALLLKPLPADFKEFFGECKPFLQGIIAKVLERA